MNTFLFHFTFAIHSTSFYLYFSYHFDVVVFFSLIFSHWSPIVLSVNFHCSAHWINKKMLIGELFNCLKFNGCFFFFVSFYVFVFSFFFFLILFPALLVRHCKWFSLGLFSNFDATLTKIILINWNGMQLLHIFTTPSSFIPSNSSFCVVFFFFFFSFVSTESHSQKKAVAAIFVEFFLLKFNSSSKFIFL